MSVRWANSSRRHYLVQRASIASTLPKISVEVFHCLQLCSFSEARLGWSSQTRQSSTGSKSPAQSSAPVAPASTLLRTSFSRAPPWQNSDVKPGRSRWTFMRSCRVGLSSYRQSADFAMVISLTIIFFFFFSEGYVTQEKKSSTTTVTWRLQQSLLLHATKRPLTGGWKSPNQV